MTPPAEAPRMAYVGYCNNCGAMFAASVDDPKYARDTAKFVAQLIRDGARVDRVTCEAVRGQLASCSCKSVRKADAAQLTLTPEPAHADP